VKKEKAATLATARLTLGPITEAEEAQLLRILTSEEIAETYMLPEFGSEAEAIPLARRLQALSVSPEHILYGIYLEGSLIGFINDVMQDGDAIEMGYVIHPDHKGNGYATEAFAAVIGHLLSMGFREIRAGAFEGNRASMRVMEKCCLTPTGQTEEIPYRGQLRRCVCYCLSRDTVIGEIRRMEALFDELRQALAEDPAATESAEFREKLRQLADYYEGGRWLRHYEMDEAGLLPHDLKRGVLSQDGVYDFLSAVEGIGTSSTE
jgi:RimJ/RimL family protein N-acetyltransferase